MTDTLTVLGPTAVRRWFEQGLRSMLAVRRQVDVLNVFPVPDGDTGTNLVLTLVGAARAAGRLGPTASLGELTAAAARGALVGARGNSGVILSQAMRGLARATAGQESLDGPGLAAALEAAAQDARAAVEQPVEGTVLTVAAAAAQAAREASDAGLSGVVSAATRAAGSALAGTRSQLPVLAERGVVDAGAAGYVILLEALAAVVDGGAPASSRAREGLAGLWATPRPAPGGPACALGASVVGDGAAGEEGADRLEVMYVLRATAARAAELRARLSAAGDSVAVVGGSDAPDGAGLWQVHVHTTDPRAVLAEPAEMEQVCVRSLGAPALGVVACTRLPGLVAPLAATGAVVVLHPDPPGLERGVADAAARHVLLLPCDADSAALAHELTAPSVTDAPGRAGTGDGAAGHGAGGDQGTAAAALPSGGRVDVAATRSEVAVLAAVAEQQPDAPQDARLAAANGTAHQVRAADCAVENLEDAVRGLLRPDDELLTAVVGDLPDGPAREDVLDRLRSAVAAVAPQAELVALDGHQSHPDLLLGAQ